MYCKLAVATAMSPISFPTYRQHPETVMRGVVGLSSLGVLSCVAPQPGGCQSSFSPSQKPGGCPSSLESRVPETVPFLDLADAPSRTARHSARQRSTRKHLRAPSRILNCRQCVRHSESTLVGDALTQECLGKGGKSSDFVRLRPIGSL